MASVCVGNQFTVVLGKLTVNKVQGAGCRVQGAGCRVQGTRYKV